MFHFLKEIRAVGLKDWLWFVCVLERDEFHRSLDWDPFTDDLDTLLKRRQRAHEIDELLEELKRGHR